MLTSLVQTFANHVHKLHAFCYSPIFCFCDTLATPCIFAGWWKLCYMHGPIERRRFTVQLCLWAGMQFHGSMHGHTEPVRLPWSRLREWTSSISSEELASIAARRSYTATLAKKKQVEQKRWQKEPKIKQVQYSLTKPHDVASKKEHVFLVVHPDATYVRQQAVYWNETIIPLVSVVLANVELTHSCQLQRNTISHLKAHTRNSKM